MTITRAPGANQLLDSAVLKKRADKAQQQKNAIGSFVSKGVDTVKGWFSEKKTPENTPGISEKAAPGTSFGGGDSPEQMVQQVGGAAHMAKDIAKGGIKKGLSKGTNKAALAKMAAGAIGIESDNAAGGAVNTALTAATMTANPYIIAGAAVFGAIQGSAEADRQKREARAKGIEAESKALSKGEAARRESVGRMSESMAGFFNNNRIAKL